MADDSYLSPEQRRYRLEADLARLREDNQRLQLLLDQAEDYAREQGDTAAEMERELDSCQEISDRHYSDAQRLTAENARLQDALRDAEALNEEIRALHQPDGVHDDRANCLGCELPYPCPTAKLLEPDDDDDVEPPDA